MLTRPPHLLARLYCTTLRMTSSKAPSSNMAEFRQQLRTAKHILVLTGAGISAESGVPTFRGAGGFWRRYESTSLATPSAFARDPSLVWQFYHYRRELVRTCTPNAAHRALVEFERYCQLNDRTFVCVTQNVDDLHARAGTTNLLQLHGSLYRVRCTGCSRETHNDDSPICEALRNCTDMAEAPRIPTDQLPHCTECGGLLRPAIVWFGEGLPPKVIDQANEHVKACDMCLVVGTSSVVYPAAMFAPLVASRGVVVAEFNIESTPATSQFGYHFAGPAAHTLSTALALPLV